MPVLIMSVMVINDIPPMRIKIQATTVIDVGRVLMGPFLGAREPMLDAARHVKLQAGGHRPSTVEFGRRRDHRQVIKCRELPNILPAYLQTSGDIRSCGAVGKNLLV